MPIPRAFRRCSGENRQLLLSLFQHPHPSAKNTGCRTSGMRLSGFIVFDKIPRILFMRKFWHNGRPWRAPARSRCPGLRPPSVCRGVSSFLSGVCLLPANAESTISQERGLLSQPEFKKKNDAVTPKWVSRQIPHVSARTGTCGFKRGGRDTGPRV